MEILKQMKKSNELIVDLTNRSKSERLTIDVLTHKIEELEAKVVAIPGLMEKAGQLQQAEHKIDGLQDLLNSAQTRISDISQEKFSSIQQIQDGATKDIEQLKHVHQLELDKAVLETVGKTRDEYTAKLDAISLKNDTLTTRNQELTERIHVLELQKNVR